MGSNMLNFSFAVNSSKYGLEAKEILTVLKMREMYIEKKKKTSETKDSLLTALCLYHGVFVALFFS